VYFARPNGEVVLRNLIGETAGDEKPMTADEWIVQRVKLRNIANYGGPATWAASRGTEHTKANTDVVV